MKSRCAIVVWKPAGHQRLPTGLADGDVDVSVCKSKALGRKRVDMGRDIFYLGAVDTDTRPLKIIRRDEQEIYGLARFRDST